MHICLEGAHKRYMLSQMKYGGQYPSNEIFALSITRLLISNGAGLQQVMICDNTANKQCRFSWCKDLGSSFTEVISGALLRAT